MLSHACELTRHCLPAAGKAEEIHAGREAVNDEHHHLSTWACHFNLSHGSAKEVIENKAGVVGAFRLEALVAFGVAVAYVATRG